MRVTMRLFDMMLPVVLAASLVGCEEPPAPKPEPAKPAATPKTPPPPPTPSVKPPPKDHEDCPEGSKGPGTRREPCEGSGDARMLEVTYTGKTTDKGPKFRVVNKSDKAILFGSVTAYFYDKAGKQLEVTVKDKQKAKQGCSGNIFAGQVKPKEKIYVFFSCVKKDHVPEGTAAIEAEVETVGFADQSGEKNDFYWHNEDLAPDERPKGGIKPDKKKKK